MTFADTELGIVVLSPAQFSVAARPALHSRPGFPGELPTVLNRGVTP